MGPSVAPDLDVQGILEDARTAADRAALEAQAHVERLRRVAQWMEDRALILNRQETELQKMQKSCQEAEASQKALQEQLREEEVKLQKERQDALRMQVTVPLWSPLNPEGRASEKLLQLLSKLAEDTVRSI